MTQLSEADGVATHLSMRTLALVLRGRLEGLVSPTILDPGERQRQAASLGCFIAAALGFLLAAPCLWLTDLGPRGAAFSIVAAGACLAASGALSATGRLEAVLTGSAALTAMVIGMAATATGGVSSPLLWLLAVAPLEGLLHGRRTLAGYAAGLGCLVLGAVTLAQWFGFVGTLAGAALGWTAAALASSYGGLLVGRLVKASVTAREAQRRSDAEFASIENALTDAVLRYEPDGRLASASRPALALFAGSEGPLSTADVMHAIHVTDRVRYLQAFAEVRGGTDQIAVEIKVKSNVPGALGFIDVVVKFRAVKDDNGRLRSLIAIAADRSTECAATSRLELALAEERRGSDAKSRFLAAVSHELRTPLNAIIGFSDVLDQEFFGGFENPRQKEYVGLIRQSGEHLLSLVNGLLDLSKIEAGRYELDCETFAVAEAVRTALHMIEPDIARKGLALEVRIRCAEATVVADRRACHQILLNLLSNAVKFTDRGTVTLEADIVDGMLAISISDTGIGIASTDLDRLGMPFMQLSQGTNRRYQGTGLGLSLVKGLCTLHGGLVEIESEAGIGTVVTVRIPRDAKARIDQQSSSKETVVALAHARTTSNFNTPNSRTRRSA